MYVCYDLSINHYRYCILYHKMYADEIYFVMEIYFFHYPFNINVISMSTIII